MTKLRPQSDQALDLNQEIIYDLIFFEPGLEFRVLFPDKQQFETKANAKEDEAPHGEIYYIFLQEFQWSLHLIAFSTRNSFPAVPL